MHRTENQTPDESIPWETYPGKSVFIHGSVVNRYWREKLLLILNDYDVLVLDPWRLSWMNYKQANADILYQIETYGGPPDPEPDVKNLLPFFWEIRNLQEADFHYFEFDSEEDMAEHIIICLMLAIKKNPNNVIVRIPNEDFRVNISIFLRDLPKENYFVSQNKAFDKLKSIMGL